MQISMFDLDCQKPYKIKKHIRLIELFGGIGSQAKALKNLKANFTHYRLCEFDKYAVTSYNAVHSTNFEPSDITKISAKDLGITETDKYDYILTYSFPCQDLSIVGKQAGMEKGSGTRSGLLWEVERLLEECEELPQILLMENVPQVHGNKNKKSFYKWIEKLESLGYRNYWQDLNAKGFGIPQNRNRTFMVSVLGDYYYNFPKPKKLKLRLKDMLEKEVDEKYYIKNAKVKTLLKGLDYENADKVCCDMTINQPRFRDIAKRSNIKNIMTKTASTLGTNCGSSTSAGGGVVIEPKCEVVATLDIPGRFESACRVHGIDGIAPACNTCGGGGLETKIAEPVLVGGIGDINFGKQFRQGNRIYDSEAIACALTASPVGNAGGESYLYKVAEPIIFDDFNQRVKADQTAINTLTTNCGSSAERNGIKVIEPKTNERFFRQAIETANKNECENGDTINAFNKTVDKTGISPTITTRPEGFKTAILPIQNYRIRKLTPKECWRLMGFSDKDFYAAQSAGVSNSQLYKQAGNSIVVNVLEEIFKKLF